MSKYGLLILGETDFASFENTTQEAKASAVAGANYIKENIHEPSHPVSFVGLMLDGDWMDTATPHQKGITNGIITGICYDTVFQSRTYHSELHTRFKQPTFLFTAFKRKLDIHTYDYYLRMVGVVEWSSTEKMCAQTMEAFKLVQKKSPIEYAADSIVRFIGG